MGPSGRGKSTLLNLVAGLDPADDGEMVLDGETINETGRGLTGPHAPWPHRHRLPVLQPPRGHDRAGERRPTGDDRGQPSQARQTRARDLLDLLGIGDKADELPAVLSGGQRQRLAIARALANQPTLLLADEPTGALDSDGGGEVLELFRRLHDDGQTILMVTHSDEVAVRRRPRDPPGRGRGRRPSARPRPVPRSPERRAGR